MCVLAKEFIANKKKISFEEAKRLDKNNESMPPWQQLHPSPSSGTASSSRSPSSPADAATNLFTDSTNTNCNGNDKTSGKPTNSPNRTK